MKPKRLADRYMRRIARRERDFQWELMERVAREGIVWMCPWDKYKRHKNGDGVYVFGLIRSNEFYHWLGSHKDWWILGRWSEKRCARSIRITEAGREALANRKRYDMEPIFGGMVEPGYVVTPWPRKRAADEVPEFNDDDEKRHIYPRPRADRGEYLRRDRGCESVTAAGC